MRNIERKPAVPYAEFPLLGARDMRLRDVPRLSKKDIGKWVVGIRQSLGMTQEQFAVELGVLRSQVGKWETGVNRPDHENTRRIEALSDAGRRRQTPVVVSAHQRHQGTAAMEEELVKMFRLLPVLDQAEMLVELKKRTATASQQSAAPSKA